MSTDAITTERPMPPVVWLSSAALGLVVLGGISLAAYAPRTPGFTVPTTLLVLSWAAMAFAVLLLVRIKDFAWTTFNKVFAWSLLAYVIEAGMIEYVFVRNHTRGTALVEVSLMLVIFATSVPVNIAFTTARYAER